MKFNPELVEYLGNITCACIADITLEKKMPQILLSTGTDSPKQIRMVMLDNEQHRLTPEQIIEKLSKIKACPGKDVGFSYTHEGLRIIIVPEDMSIFPVLGAPLGTGRG